MASKTLTLFLWLLAGVAGASQAAVLTSADGRSRDFAVVLSASPQGLTVRETPTSRNVTIAWGKLNLTQSCAANPWLAEAHRRAQTGATVALNIKSTAPTSSVGSREARVVREGSARDNFTRLTLAGRLPREIAKPRLAVVALGTPTSWSAREDAVALAGQQGAALITAAFEGEDWSDATRGSGEALLSGIAEMLAGAPVSPHGTAAPAFIVMSQGATAAALAWSLVCHTPDRVLAVITIDGEHHARPTADVFATPALFLQTTGPAPLTKKPGTEDITRPFDLWRQYSTDGCRWCFAAQPADPLATALAFAGAVAAASPYQEVIAQWEAYEDPTRKNTLPLPVRTLKDWDETAFRLAELGGKPVYPIASRTGTARQQLIWLPNEAFASFLAPATR